ncbi:MAG: hypothetical protein KBC95_00400 [Candidatus Peribacteraceae bacterium]|nr:hypothetical protein [Candidatus Peribacteraceae bacterium]
MSKLMWPIVHPFITVLGLVGVVVMSAGGYKIYEVVMLLSGYWTADTVAGHAEYISNFGLNVAYVTGGLVALVKSGWLTRIAVIGWQAWSEKSALAREAAAIERQGLTELLTAFKEGKIIARP